MHICRETNQHYVSCDYIYVGLNTCLIKYDWHWLTNCVPFISFRQGLTSFTNYEYHPGMVHLFQFQGRVHNPMVGSQKRCRTRHVTGAHSLHMCHLLRKRWLAMVEHTDLGWFQARRKISLIYLGLLIYHLAKNGSILSLASVCCKKEHLNMLRAYLFMSLHVN